MTTGGKDVLAEFVTFPITLEPETYKLTVQTTPPDSTIKFDKSKLDYRPGLELAPGRYDLVVMRDGYKPARRTVVVNNADVTLDVALEPEKKYRLTVQAVPMDSTVRFDNSKLDYRPGLELAPGRYDLVVTHEGYKPARRTVVVSNADVTLDVALDAIKYKLTVQVTPADSTVKFDNSKLDYRPGIEIEPGRYEIVVTRNGYKAARRWVSVHNTEVTLDVVLEPEKTAPVASPPPGVGTSHPIITVKQEDVPRNVGQAISRITIKGQVTDDNGVAEVTVNGRKADLSADGTFVATDVLLRVGDNVIRITALNIYGNTGEVIFTIRREGTTRVSDPQPNPSPPVDSPASTPTVTIQRYLTMEVPEEVIPDQEFAIQVAFTMEQRTPEVKVVSGTTTAEGQLALSLPPPPQDADSWKIDVVMSAPDFTFRAGMNTSAVVLPRQGDSTPAVFYLRAKPIRGGQKVGHLYATLWYQGAYLAKVVRAVTIVAPAGASPPTVRAPSQPRSLSEN